MASLHKDPRGKSKYWYCAFTLPNGQRTFRSTGETEKKPAWSICKRWEETSDSARHGELTRTRAEKVVSDILESIGEAPLSSKTVRQFFENWIEGKTLAKTAATSRRYTAVIQSFLEAIGPAADKSLLSLRPEDVELFRNHRIRSGVSPQTVGLDLVIIRSVLSSAEKQRLIVHNVAESVESPKGESLERETFTREEIRSLLDEASPDWKTAILIGYFVGSRLGDTIRLSWENVDRDMGRITYRQIKTKKEVPVPLHPMVREHLQQIAGDDPRGFLCPLLATAGVAGRNGASQQFMRLMDRAGVDRRSVQSSKNYRFSRLSFHSLRHSLASALTNAGISNDVRMKILGHSSVDVHQGYSHVQFEPLRAAIEALPNL